MENLPLLSGFKGIGLPATLKGAIALTVLCVFPAQAEWQMVDSATTEQGRQVYVRGSGYYSDASINVEESALLSDKLRLVVTSSSYPVTNADGATEDGLPYFDVSNVAESIRITFAMQRARFSYSSALYQDVPAGKPDPSVVGPINFDNASVHDPSIIKLDNGEYYVFGSHLAAAKSNDLVNWYSVTPDGVENTPLFDSYTTEAADGIAWSGGHVGSWAADVIQLADDKYYFYYNHCASPDTGECDASRSYMGLAVSENIEGPYRNVGLFLTSGHVGNENPAINGENYDGNHHPNAIDPDVFFDKEGRLWMVYGSYSGGIWVMEMDPASGLPLAEQGYGTKIMGGFYSAIEGPYMLYSPESDYYYLFTSFGGFAQNDGYNMRVARSRHPQGPFEDAQGVDMIGALGGWSSIEPYGVKLMGGHLFDVNPGETGSDHGYMAPGHNSAYYDADTGKHYLILHTRFPDRGEGHEIRVHELFVNADGWLVASPHRYIPIEGENIVDEHDLLGVYRFINHEKDINRSPKVSRYLRLLENGEIGGDFSGHYELGDTNQITLHIDNQGSFEGIMAWQWNDNINQLVPTFSALALSGVSVWGSQIPAMTTIEALNAIQSAISLPSVVTSDLDLPTRGALGANISWSSSNRNVVDDNGNVTRPSTAQEDASITLLADIELNGETLTLEFNLIVPARKLFDRIAHYQFEGNLADSLGQQVDGTMTGTTPFTIDGNVQYATGELNQALWLDGATGVRLPDGLISNNAYTVSMWMNPSVLTQFTAAFFGSVSGSDWISLVPWSWDDNTMLWRGSVAWYNASAGLQIPEAEWSHVAFTVDNGTLVLYVNGTQVFNGIDFNDIFTGQNALFSLGVNHWDIPYQGLIDEFTVYDAALQQQEIVALDIERLDISQLLNVVADSISLGDLTLVKDNLLLPQSGLFTSVIQWASSNPDVINPDGVVTRPGEEEADASVTLTATISIGGTQTTRQFFATVRSLAPVTPVAEFNFDLLDLTDAQGNFSAGITTGPFIGDAGTDAVFSLGIENNALALDGASGVRLADNLITDNTYSVSMWLNPEELTMFTSAFFGYAALDNWISLVPRGHDFVSQQTMIWSGVAWYDAGIGRQIPLNTWSHIVFVVNEGNLMVYLNGVVAFSGNNFPDVFSGGGTNSFGIGVNYWDTPFKGLVDELKIYDEAITATDVQQLYDMAID